MPAVLAKPHRRAGIARRWEDTPGTARVVLCAAAAATLLKLVLAWQTLGTDDVKYWAEFADGVEDFGPIGIYGHTFVAQYNHGPLAGWLLAGVNLGQAIGLDLAFLIRVPASLADAVTCWLVYRLLSERGGAVGASWAAVGVVWSPVLLTVSGFHGNTDSVFVMLCLASFWLLTRRDRPLWAGLAIGVAVSVKLVPLVVLPWLLFLAFRCGRAALARFVVGGGLVFALLWLPVVLLRWQQFYDNVLRYQGIWLREWGIAEFVERAGHPAAELWLAEHGSYVALVAALVPFLVSRNRADGGSSGLGLTLVTMLLLTPAYGMQYLAWALAPAYLVCLRAAWVYNIAASVFVVVVYSDWNDAPPWWWYEAAAMPFTANQSVLMMVTWAGLLLVLLGGLLGSVPRTVYSASGTGGGLAASTPARQHGDQSPYRGERRGTSDEPGR